MQSHEDPVRSSEDPGATLVREVGQRMAARGRLTGSDIFFAAVSMAGMPMIITDPHTADNPVVFANQAFIDQTGYALSEILGRNCRFMQGPLTDVEVVRRLGEAIRTRRDIAVELVNYRRDGSSYWNCVYVSPLVDEDGRLLYFFASQLDVTGRREADDALSRSQRLEGLGALAGGMAHEFNNLLTIIRGNLEPLLRDAVEPVSARRLARVRDAAERASLLTRSMISFARRQLLDERMLELNEFVRGHEREMQAAVGPDRTVLVITSAEVMHVHADPDQLRLALLNVLMNAYDAGSRDGMVRVRVRAAPPLAGGGADVEVAIADTGTGMSPETARRAVDPFFTTRQPGKGVGLGLSAAHGFLRQSGGRLVVESSEGEGTTVRLVLPRREPATVVADAVERPG